MRRKEVELGDVVKDPVTGYEGVAYSRTLYIQGCDRIGIQAPMVQKKGELPEVPDLFVVDEPQLDIITRIRKPKAKKRGTPGGPSGFEPSSKQR